MSDESWERTLDLAWKDWREFRQQTKEEIVESRTGQLDEPSGTRTKSSKDPYACKNIDCSSFASLIEPTPGQFTCVACGYTEYSVPLSRADRPMLGFYRKSAPYRELTHLREVLALLKLDGPEIAPYLLGLVDMHWALYYAGHIGPDDFTRSFCKRMLEEIYVPPDLQRQFQSKRYKKNLCENLERNKHLSEQWLWFRHRYTGAKPKKIGRTLQRHIEEFFTCIIKPWYHLRHTEECMRDGGPRKNCHHTHGCKHNLPVYGVIIRWTLRLIERKYRGWRTDFFCGERETWVDKGVLEAELGPYLSDSNTPSTQTLMTNVFRYWNWDTLF